MTLCIQELEAKIHDQSNAILKLNIKLDVIIKQKTNENDFFENASDFIMKNKDSDIENLKNNIQKVENLIIQLEKDKINKETIVVDQISLTSQLQETLKEKLLNIHELEEQMNEKNQEINRLQSMNQELRLKMENFETESKEEKKLVERLEKEVKEKSKEASRLQIQFSQLNQDFNEAKELLKATKTEIISKDEVLKSIQNILTKLFPNSAAPHDLPLWIQTGFSNFSKIIRSMFVDFFEKEELTLPDQKHFKDFIIECLYVIKDSSTQAIYQDKIFIEIFNMIGKFYSSPITKQNCFHIIRRIFNEILNLKGNQSFEAFLNESERLKQEINDLKQKNVRSQTIISSQTKQIEILQEYERENWKDWALSVYFSVTRTRSCNLNSSQLQQFIENSLFKVTLLRPYPQVKSGRTIVPLAIAVIFISRLTSQRMPHQISLFY